MHEHSFPTRRSSDLLFVKVEPHWRDNQAVVSSLDYRSDMEE
jgi:hypothetical protein